MGGSDERPKQGWVDPDRRKPQTLQPVRSVEEEENRAPPGTCSETATQDRARGLGHVLRRGCAEAPCSHTATQHLSTEKFLWLRNNLVGRRKQTAKLLRSLSLIAKPEASPGPTENRASSPAHLPSRAYLGLGRPQSRARHSRAQPFRGPSLRICIALFLLKVGKRAFRGLDNADCSLRQAETSRPKTPCSQTLPARQHRLENME